MNEILAMAIPLLSLSSAAIFFLFPTIRLRALSAILLLEVFLSAFLVYCTLEGTILVVDLGGWSPPLGIVLVIDLFSALMLTVSNGLFLVTTLFWYQDRRRFQGPDYTLSLIFFMQTGATLSLLAGDYFNLFVAFELMLLSSYGIMALEADVKQSKHVYHYLIVSITSSALFLVSVAMVYGWTGELNLAMLAQKLESMQNSPKVVALALYALLVFGLKAGIFPFYFWLPGSYAALPGSLSGLFSGILTKISICVLLRLFLTVFPRDLFVVYDAVLFLSGFTMFLGVLGAVSKRSIKKILCYHVVSQLGYIFMALGCFSLLSISAGIFFTVHNMVVKSSLLLIGGFIYMRCHTDDLDALGGLASFFPVASLFFMLQALSLAGIPPFSGFWGKYLLFAEALRTRHFILVTVAGVTSFLTLFSMMKIWSGSFYGPVRAPFRKGSQATLGMVGVLVIAALVMAFGTEAILSLTNKAASQLFDNGRYINAVLGRRG